jgi:hypothetical protein
VIAADTSGNFASFCGYEAPSLQAECSAQVASAAPSLASTKFTATNFAIGYTAIRGASALVGTTGTFCVSSQCYTNSDPAAILSSGEPFSTLWDGANNSSSGFAYSLIPCTEIDGKWYASGGSGG